MFYTIAITLLPSNFISNSIDALHTFEAVAEVRLCKFSWLHHISNVSRRLDLGQFALPHT